VEGSCCVADREAVGSLCEAEITYHKYTYHIAELEDVCFISDIYCVHEFSSSISHARPISSSSPISPRHELSPVRSDNFPASPQSLRILYS
jgi:hypothetical protein